MKRRAPKSRAQASVSPDMNVTPLVDVVLVLLIIFMVMAPLTTSAFGVRLPPKLDPDLQNRLAQVNKPSENLVMKVNEDGSAVVNKIDVPADQLAAQLKQMFETRNDHVLYMDAANEAPYHVLLEAMEECRKVGADPIVLMTKELK